MKDPRGSRWFAIVLDVVVLLSMVGFSNMIVPGFWDRISWYAMLLYFVCTVIILAAMYCGN